jgi:hypothetical protein
MYYSQSIYKIFCDAFYVVSFGVFYFALLPFVVSLFLFFYLLFFIYSS